MLFSKYLGVTKSSNGCYFVNVIIGSSLEEFENLSCFCHPLFQKRLFCGKDHKDCLSAVIYRSVMSKKENLIDQDLI